MKKYRFYSDAGHGWLAVKRNELTQLGIENKISSCSYSNGQTVYLEEDCDAYTFIKAWEQINGQKFTYTTKHSEKTSPIRSYPHYTSLSKL